MHRLYENKDISVFWDSDKCRHAKKCVESSPATFDPLRRPWIDIEKADTPEIWQAVKKCPSGALTCAYNHEIIIKYNEAGSCSEAYHNGQKVGECDYRVSSEAWVIFHTEVSPEFGGKEIAKRLVYRIAEEADRRKVELKATCSYAIKILEL